VLPGALHPCEKGPALAHRLDDLLSALGILHIGSREVDHQQAAGRVDRNVPLAPFHPLGGIIAASVRRCRSFDGLAVDHAGRRARLPASLLPVEHQGDIVQGLEQQAADKAPEPPIHRLPGPELMRQHAPAAAGVGQIMNGIEDLAQVHLGLAAALGGLGQDRSDPLLFLIGQVSGVAPPLKSLLALAMFFRPHPAHVDPTLPQSDPLRHCQTRSKGARYL
jgi:hypothetical protein